MLLIKLDYHFEKEEKITNQIQKKNLVKLKVETFDTGSKFIENVLSNSCTFGDLYFWKACKGKKKICKMTKWQMWFYEISRQCLYFSWNCNVHIRETVTFLFNLENSLFFEPIISKTISLFVPDHTAVYKNARNCSYGWNE